MKSSVKNSQAFDWMSVLACDQGSDLPDFAASRPVFLQVAPVLGPGPVPCEAPARAHEAAGRPLQITPGSECFDGSLKGLATLG